MKKQYSRGLGLAAALLMIGLCHAQDAPRSAAALGAASESGARTPADGRSVSAAASPQLSQIVKDYRVGANDLLEVEVLDVENMKRTVRVNSAGVVSLPLIGVVQVAGLTSQEAETRIADRYREKYLQNPQVTIFIKEFTTERITVEGAVARPGIFPLTGQMTLLRALALAGGFGPIANHAQVMLFRGNDQRTQEVKVYDIEKIRSGTSEDPIIRGDDLIVVQQDKTRKLLKDSVLRDIVDSINPFSLMVR